MANEQTTPLKGWRTWPIATFMWLACRFVPSGYVIKYELVENAE